MIKTGKNVVDIIKSANSAHFIALFIILWPSLHNKCKTPDYV